MIDDYQKENIKKVIGLIKEGLGGKIMWKFVGLGAYMMVLEVKKKKTQTSVSWKKT